MEEEAFQLPQRQPLPDADNNREITPDVTHPTITTATVVTGDNEPHAFMRATYGDSIAKAEKKAKDLRNSKRQSDIAGRRTKLREQLQTPSLGSDSPREI